MSSLPLEGIRVLDLTTTVSGPVATLRLAQYGAEVIKVEAPGGDVLRTLGGASPTGTLSGQYLHLNHGKKAICLDLKTGEGRSVVKRLLATCDVLVTNMRAQALQRLGLDAHTLRSAFPRLVYCTISGYGSNGPYAGKPAYDSVIQGAAGFVGINQQRDVDARFLPLLICDHVTGEITAGAVISALFNRATTGEGTEIEVPMFETMAAFVLQEHMARATFDPPIGPSGDVRLLNPASRPARTSDGWIALTANTDDQCRRMMRCGGLEHFLDDPRFTTVADRVRNLGEWLALRDDMLLRRTSVEWLDDFWANDVPAMPCHSIDSLMEDGHLKEVGLIDFADHATEGTTRTIRSSVLLDGRTIKPTFPARALGQDTVSVLKELGYSTDEMDILRSRNVIIQMELQARQSGLPSTDRAEHS